METKLSITRGDTKQYNLTFTAGDEPLDLEGYEIKFTVKGNLDDPDSDAVISKLASVTSEPNGEAVINLTSEDTDQNLGNYKYDIQLSNDSTVKTVMKGTIDITYDVTREP